MRRQSTSKPGRYRRLVASLLASTAAATLATPVKAECVPDLLGTTYVCSEANTDTQIAGSPLDVTVATEPGFSVDTSETGGDALVINGGLGAVYVDENASALTGAGSALRISALGDVVVETGGAITANAFGGYGVHASSLLGDVSVTLTGEVSAGNATGVYAETAGSGIRLETGAVSGLTGIVTNNNGLFDTIVITNGQVRSSEGQGIFVTNGANANAIAIVTQGVTGATAGMDVINNGRGGTTIRANGPVIGGFDGIRAENGDTATHLTIETGAVTGGIAGINATNNGIGNTRIASTGPVTGGNEAGIYVRNGVNTGDLTVEAAAVTGGGTAAIEARNNGIGDTRVTVSGQVTGTGDGMFVTSGDGAGSLFIDVVEGAGVTGADDGINARNSGTGTTTINTSGPVIGTSGYGVLVHSGDNTSDLEITTGVVTGRGRGIRAMNEGRGITRITATGAVTATDSEGIGIHVENLWGGDPAADPTRPGYIQIEATDVTGGSGISVLNQGSGNSRVTVTGTVTANGEVGDDQTDGAGITVLHSGDGEVGIGAVDINATGSGIYVQNEGAATTMIATTGVVTGGLAGIFASNGENTTGLQIEAHNLSGAAAGIVASNDGAGLTMITTSGLVQGGQYGIGALNGENTTSLEIQVVDVTGGTGIFAINGGGSTRITSTGTIIANGGENAPFESTGIVVLHGGAGDATIDAVNVNAAGSGVAIVNEGAGFTRITTTGDVTGGLGGIVAFNGEDATGIGITAHNVIGEQRGISVENAGGGITDIRTTGLVEGGDAGIVAQSLAGADISILSDGIVRNISGASSDLAVVTQGGATQFISNGTLTGAVRFESDDDDLLVNTGTWNSAGAANAFGGGADRVENRAGARLIGGGAAGSAEVTSFEGLERLDNAGLITLADGGAGDRMETSGAVVFGANSAFHVDVGGASPADILAAGGAVTVDGRLVANLTGAPALNRRYTVLTGSAVAGTFDFDDAMLTAFAALRDGYTPTSVYLEFAQVRALTEAGITPNQIATARGADSLPNGNAVRDALIVLPDDVSARAAFDRLSGELHPSIRSAMTEDSRLPRNAVLERLNETGGGAAWGQVFRNWGESDGNRNAAPLDRRTWGMVAGADMAIGGSAVIGVAGAYLDTRLDADRRDSTGSIRSMHVLGYAGIGMGPFRLKLGAGYGWADVETVRPVAFPGFSDRLSAEYDGSILQGFAEAGYRLQLGGGQVEPFAGLIYVKAKTDGFTEAGGPAALSVARASEASTISTAGLRFGSAPDASFAVEGMIGWQHGFGSLGPASVMRFAGGGDFRITGAPLSRNAAVANFAARFRLAPKMTMGVRYDGVIGDRSRDQAMKAELRIAF